MACFAQDGTGDLLLSTDKRFTLITDKAQCAAQNLTNRFLLFEGEWFLDTRLGFPFYRVIAVKNPDIRTLRQVFSRVILTTQSIVAINRLDIVLHPNRSASVDLECQCDNGAIIVGGNTEFIVKLGTSDTEST